jgi:hypothetical protein
MPKHEVILFVLAGIGGIAGPVGALIWSPIVDVLNSKRAASDQIPFGFASRKGFAWLLENYPYPFRKMLKEFRRQYPESRLHLWYIIRVVWMFSFLAVAAVVLILGT